jgi:hypothetical protein
MLGEVMRMRKQRERLSGGEMECRVRSDVFRNSGEGGQQQ